MVSDGIWREKKESKQQKSRGTKNERGMTTTTRGASRPQPRKSWKEGKFRYKSAISTVLMVKT